MNFLSMRIDIKNMAFEEQIPLEPRLFQKLQELIEKAPDYEMAELAFKIKKTKALIMQKLAQLQETT